MRRTEEFAGSRIAVLLLVCTLVPLSLRPAPNQAVEVGESGIQVHLRDGPTRVVLPVLNGSGQPLRAKVSVELLDPPGNIRSQDSLFVVLQPGDNNISVPLRLPFASLEPNLRRESYWYRLRYSVRPEGAEAPAAEGVVSLAQIAPDFYLLKLSAPLWARPAHPFPVRVRALHPVTDLPVRGVSLRGTIEVEYSASRSELRAEALTDADGTAELLFEIPAGIIGTDVELEVEGRLGEFVTAATEDFHTGRWADLLIHTDKPVYQPGQVLHLRVLARDYALNRPLPRTKLVLRIEDPERVVVFRQELETSTYGIAHTDWPIPENLRLGDYLIHAESDDESHEDFGSAVSIRISRYELPSFSVSVSPDRPYYLLDQEASVEVRAEYLWGEPVRRGRVRVARQTAREWSYFRQEWETKEEDVQEGETDEASQFVARLDLAAARRELAEWEYLQYEDSQYVASFTDLSTGRTEERRFEVRVTRHPIHIRVIEWDYAQTEDFPLEFFLTAYYADGTPAECDITITQQPAENNPGPSELVLRTVHTNRYGVAEVRGLVLSEDGRSELIFRARDAEGRTGEEEESFWLRDDPGVRVYTDKPLYQAGEPIQLELAGSSPDELLLVDVATRRELLWSTSAQLRGGRAALTIPSNQRFQGEVSIAVHGFGVPPTHRTVLFPEDPELGLQIEAGKTTFRPGETADIAFAVGAGGNAPPPAVLGVVVYDKAVEEFSRIELGGEPRHGFYLPNEYGGRLADMTLGDIRQLDPAKPLPEDLRLVATLLLHADGFKYQPESFDGEEPSGNPRQVFQTLIDPILKPVSQLLVAKYDSTQSYPKSEAELGRVLETEGIRLEELLDPWGVPYQPAFSVDRDKDQLALVSAGPDRQQGTEDDFNALEMAWPYFKLYGAVINRVVSGSAVRTGSYLRTAEALKAELARDGLDFDSLRDPWGRPYRLQFNYREKHLVIEVMSGGPHEPRPGRRVGSNEFAVWRAEFDYFSLERARIDGALRTYARRHRHLPRNDADLAEALRPARIDFASLRDPWGNSYYPLYARESRYSDRVTLKTVQEYGHPPEQRREVVPVVQTLEVIQLWSRGENGEKDPRDDFTVATFSHVVAEQSGVEKTVEPLAAAILLTEGAGAIAGQVIDPTGAIIPGCRVVVMNQATKELFYTRNTDERGLFGLSGLAPGLYTVQVHRLGFKSYEVRDVPVRKGEVTTLEVVLEVGAVAETVEVAGSSVALLSESTSAAMVAPLKVEHPRQLATPRLRQYFPETLLWQPALETDAQGRVRLSVPLADNITTWKLSAMASTEDGRIATAERELRAFQPFFVEHEPPKVLTEGDEILLPVNVRNYTGEAQAVQVEFDGGPAFELLGAAKQELSVEAGDAAQAHFGLRARAPVSEGRQRVSARNQEFGDAVEKSVEIRPNGREVTQSASRILSDSAAMELGIPSTALPGSLWAELRFYPDLVGHLMESVEGIRRRPTGCAEQVISAVYPSLLLLQLSERTGRGSPTERVRWRRDVQAGYEKLLSYRTVDGGFSFWGQGNADTALTAYALKFLHQARNFISVDEDVYEKAWRWLLRQQSADGRWIVFGWQKQEDPVRTAVLTAYVTRVLAAASATSPEEAKPGPSLARSLEYLKKHMKETEEPYIVASYALASLDVGNTEAASAAVSQLGSLARSEGDTSFWHLQTNTPFYSWGVAGRVETTALVVQALSRVPGGDARTTERGLLFLLGSKDRYGVWHSTQTTVAVTEALTAFLDSFSDSRDAGSASTLTVLVNGKQVTTLATAPNELSPARLDLYRFISVGANRVEVRRSGGSSHSSIQLVAGHYVPWPEGAAGQQATSGSDGENPLHLSVVYSRIEAEVNDVLTCKVRVERVGFRGYGMMLAEIGLPPGAEVSRESLDTAAKKSGWMLGRYDVLPERVILYLWPRAGGMDVEFTFRPRFGLNALTAPSLLYDYYNPNAEVVVAPTRFLVHRPSGPFHP